MLSDADVNRHAASMRRLTESLPPETNITDAQHRDAILGQKWNPNHTARDRWDWATRGLGPGDEVMVDGRSHILDASDVLALATSRTSKFNEFAEQASQRCKHMAATAPKLTIDSRS